jgi:NAD(P)-dependent dehydrogenase (short-subunit alcohol dehydrogenase family)
MNKVLLVTGGSRGIGAATALLAAQQGWTVAVNYTANSLAADEVVRQIRASGGNAIAVQADVADEAQVMRMYEHIDAKLGRLSGLVNNAGVVDVYARRLQVQERLTTQILDAIKDTLNPLGVAVVIEASHLCMMMRGVQKQNSATTTSAFWGEFERNETRSEFIRLIGSKLH